MGDCRKRYVDAVVVYRYDRFARSLRQLVNALEVFRGLGIDFVSLHEGVDTSTPNGRLIFGIFATIAEFERELIRDRVRSGIAAAQGQRQTVGATSRCCGHRENCRSMHAGVLLGFDCARDGDRGRHGEEGSSKGRQKHPVVFLDRRSEGWNCGPENPIQMRAESTISCPAGQYDMLDWMTLDSDLRGSYFLKGNANPLYTTMWSTKFYWTKSVSGYPWDIQVYDNNYIYLWITEWTWSDPHTFKKFALNTNMPLAPRCAEAGYPGSAIQVPNTYYEIHTACNSYTLANLKYAVNEVWGPYYYSFGGSLPGNMKTLVVSYRYNCNSSYNNCGDKEEYYLGKRYGLVQWVHYTLSNGTYVQKQKSVFNQLASGSTTPYFPCF